MSLKAELETWSAALKAYDEEDFEKALDLFSRIADTSKILTNMGLIYATLGEHEAAVERFIEATSLDQYLAVAYFQCGVSNFLLTRYELAYKDFEEAYLYLRGNQDINYEQLGLKFRLFSAEVLFNKGLSQIYLGRTQEGLADMEEARREKATEEHNVIDDAIQDRGEGYTVFSIPVGVLYRPPEKKIKNSTTKDYLGKAKLVAATDPTDTFTTFTGATRLKQGISPSGVYIDRTDFDAAVAQNNLNRSATAPAASPSRAADSARSDIPRSAGLERSKTTLNVPANARELTSGQGQSPQSARPGSDTTPVRSNTTMNVRASPGIGGPVRGLSVKRPGASPTSPPSAPPAPPAKNSENRLTEFYDDYLDSYADPNQPPLPPIRSGGAPAAAPDRVAAWARSNANPNNAPPRSGTRSAPVSNYAPSSFGGVGSGGGTLRRKLTRRNTGRTVGRVQSTYEEEEEGYASGDYEEAPFELVKIRVKVHYQDEVRGMTLTPDVPFEEFMEKLAAKFDKTLSMLGVKFKDEDGGKVTLRDESDYEMAIETARESSKGKPEGKLEIWCTDL
ncbi:putative NADPH oxidase regulator [Lyophyllum shimeji]|uniref:NADPH oxidase regulator n=1 Tax=Lyophyllum shimeji TaxID=47721 RepID=A0A9P3PJJ1_LYOSH|nr:putative NADPH oxidase regulator [Lyophyllum shimeji]